MPTSPTPFQEIGWNPPGADAIETEAMTVSQLRGRGSAEHFGRVQQPRFNTFLGVASGRFRHMIDFVTYDCGPGSWLAIKPGQVHRFDFAGVWQGWVVVCQPQVLPPSSIGTDALPDHVLLAGAARAACEQLARQMLEDARHLPAGPQRVALLSEQTRLLAMRLATAAGPPTGHARGPRGQRFRLLLETDWQEHRDVAHYAGRLHCSERTLARDVLRETGRSAKALITDRVILEARRWLAHGDHPVKEIADALGFEDTSNFIKFFRRATGTTPLVFRQSIRSLTKSPP